MFLAFFYHVFVFFTHHATKKRKICEKMLHDSSKMPTFAFKLSIHHHKYQQDNKTNQWQ